MTFLMFAVPVSAEEPTEEPIEISTRRIVHSYYKDLYIDYSLNITPPDSIPYSENFLGSGDIASGILYLVNPRVNQVVDKFRAHYRGILFVLI